MTSLPKTNQSGPSWRGTGDSRRRDEPLADDRGINVDFLWQDAGVALQIDYADFTPKERLLNAYLDDRLRASGLTVLRIPERDLRDRPEEALEQVRRAFADRGVDWVAGNLGV